MIKRTTGKTLRHLIAALDAGRTSVREQAQMWLDELQDEPDLRSDQVDKITARIERLTAEAHLMTRQIDALDIWTSVDVDNRDVEAVILLIEHYQEQRDRAIVRAARLNASPYDYHKRRGLEHSDRAAALTRYIAVLKECLI